MAATDVTYEKLNYTCNMHIVTRNSNLLLLMKLIYYNLAKAKAKAGFCNIFSAYSVDPLDTFRHVYMYWDNLILRTP